jgi:hypothetical protein
MPIIFYPGLKEQIVARGERLKWRHRVCLAFGIPFDVQAMTTDAIYTISKYLPPTLQLTDNAAAQRIAEGRAREEAERKHNPRPGDKPRLVVPR